MNSNWLRSSLLILLLAVSTASRAEEYYKEIKKTVNVNPNVILDLSVNFSDIHIETWSNPQMEIVVKMDLNVRSESRANEIFNAVNIQESASQVKLGINVNSKGGCNNSENFNISVYIKMPSGGGISGDCQFSDISLPSLSGACRFSLSYGDLKAADMSSNNNSLHIDFGDASIDNFNGGDVDGSYGDIRLQQVNGNCNLNCDFGDLRIGKVTAKCTYLDVRISYGDARVGVANNAGFTVDAKCSYGDINLNGNFKKTESESDYTSKRLKGTIGNGTGKMKLVCDFGSLSLDNSN